MPKDTSWTAFVICIFAMFVTTLIVFGVPTGGGGARGNALILERYAGQTLTPLLMGALVAGVLGAINRLRRVPYTAARRDLLVVAFVCFYFIIRGSGRLADSGETLVGGFCVAAVFLLMYKPKPRLPSSKHAMQFALGALVVALPITMIFVSLWLLNYTLIGAAIVFIAGAALLLRLLLRPERNDAR